MKSSRFSLAAHIVTLLAVEQKEGLTTSKYLARSAGTNPVVVRRILGVLGNAGLVNTQPGPRGGVRLARPPEDLTLLDVFEAVEEESLFFFGSRGKNPHCICGRNMETAMEMVFAKADSGMRAALADISLAQMAKLVWTMDKADVQVSVDFKL